MTDPDQISQQMAQLRNVARWVCLHPDPGTAEFRDEYHSKMEGLIRNDRDATVAISALSRFASSVILIASGRPEESVAHVSISVQVPGTEGQKALAETAVHLITLAMGHDFSTLAVIADAIASSGPEVCSELITILITIAREQSKGLAANMPIRAS